MASFGTTFYNRFGQERGLTMGQCLLLEGHWRLAENYNRHTNLTAIKDEESAIIKHYYDSLAVLPYLAAGLQVLDIGSGAGFPGIPLAIGCPDAGFTLMDSTAKRCNFLDEVIKELNLVNCRIVKDRCENLARNDEFREAFDVATARAVAPLAVLLEYALPFLKVGGVFIAMKGPDAEAELVLSANALVELKGELQEVMPYFLPEGAGKRNLLVFKKTASTDEKYPRKEGRPEKRPL